MVNWGELMKVYENLIGAAVEVKRLLKGHSEQSKFTKYLQSIEYKSSDELHVLQAEEMCKFLKNAVASFCSRVASGILSPATCQVIKSS